MQNADYFRQFADTVPTIIWITETDGTCSYLNGHWYNYTGQTRKDAEGFGWLAATHPHDKDAATKVFLEANQYQKPFTLLYRLRSKTGEYRWCKDSGNPKFNNEGVFEGFIGTVVDVHDEKTVEERLRESEERFRAMADASPVMIWTLDEHGNSTYYNSRAREFTGHTEKDLQEGKSWQVAIHPDDLETAGNVVRTAVENRMPYQMECRMMRVDGEWRWLLNHGTPRFGSKGEYFGYVGSSIDITERKIIEQALKESESRFRALVNASSDVIYSMNADWTVMNPLDGRGFLSNANAPIQNWMEKNVHPTEYQRVKNTIAAAIAQKSVFELEHRVVTVDGSVGWTFSRAIPILDDDGVIVEWFGAATDITQRKQAMEALLTTKEEAERQKRLYETITANTPDLIYVFDLSYRFTYANEALLQMWGRTSEQSIGKGLRENGYEEWHAVMHEREIDQVVATKKPIRGEVSFRHATLGSRIYDYISVPVINEQGEVEAVAGTTRDITDIKGAEQALRASEERLKMVLSIETVGVIYFDLEGNINDANDAFQRMSGYTQEDFVGGRVRWDEVTPPEFMEVTLHSRDEFLTRWQNTPYEKQYIRSDGSRFWGLFAGKRLSEKECVEFVVDITEQKKAQEALSTSESKLRNMILQAPVAMCIFRGKDYIVEIANDSMLEIWGKTREQVIGKPTFEANPEGKGQGFEEILETICRTGEPFRINEIPLTLLRKGKSEHFYTNLSYDPIKDQEGNVTGILVVGIEVTEQVLARQKIEEVVARRTTELALANEELRRSNANLEEFAYAASHDLKEPVRKIHFFSEKIKSTLQDRMNEAEKQSFERMELAARRMTSLIEDLLSYSQISIRPRTFEAVNMNGLIDLVLDDLDLEIEDKGATVIVDKLFTIQGHHRQLQQAFTNLIGNALKYRNSDVAPQIKISCGKVRGDETGLHLSIEEGQKTFYCIKVQDNGIGFAQQDAERIFNVFTRLHGDGQFRGTGIGLSIVRKVVENHNGHIWAESTPGKGATFNVLIPAE